MQRVNDMIILSQMAFLDFYCSPMVTLDLHSTPLKISLFSFNFYCLLSLCPSTFSFSFQLLLPDCFFRFEVLDDTVIPSFCWVNTTNASPLIHLTKPPNDTLTF
jgi:hypothetical protein